MEGTVSNWRNALIGGCAIDELGKSLPQDTLAQCRDADAILPREPSAGREWVVV